MHLQMPVADCGLGAFYLYSPIQGEKWVRENIFRSLMLRHHPVHLISSSAFNLLPVSVSSFATLPQPMHMHRFYSISGLVGWIDFMCMYNSSIKCFWVRACIANVRSNSFNESHSIGMLTVQWTCSNMSKEFGSRKIRTDVFCSDALALSLSLSLSLPLSHSHFWLSIYSNLSKMPNITRASYIECFKFDSMMVLKFLCWSLWFVPKWNHHAFGIGLLSYVRLVGEKGTIEVQEKVVQVFFTLDISNSHQLSNWSKTFVLLYKNNSINWMNCCGTASSLPAIIACLTNDPSESFKSLGFFYLTANSTVIPEPFSQKSKGTNGFNQKLGRKEKNNSQHHSEWIFECSNVSCICIFCNCTFCIKNMFGDLVSRNILSHVTTLSR